MGLLSSCSRIDLPRPVTVSSIYFFFRTYNRFGTALRFSASVPLPVKFSSRMYSIASVQRYRPSYVRFNRFCTAICNTSFRFVRLQLYAWIDQVLAIQLLCLFARSLQSSGANTFKRVTKKKTEYLLSATISLPPPAWMKELQSTPTHLLGSVVEHDLTKLGWEQRSRLRRESG